ncbi:alpha/beta hydrolase [Henriciella sp. AS95]|uniref:alpha/beta fold hydrolase n=1 Tax=Henriciella sp. AS95 TaxID=3135782 RepID=UPI003182B298
MTDIHYTSDDGLDLYAWAYGPDTAPLTVLCMHGLTRNHKDFEPMIEALGSPYRFIAVDVRGRGRSQRAADPATYTPVHYAGDMIALLNHLGIEKTALIGTSMGGLMAMLMAKSVPEKISGVVLNDVGPVVEAKGLARIAAYAGAPEPVSDWSTAAAKTAASQTIAFPDYKDEDWLAFARRTWRETGDGQLELDYDAQITKSLGESKPSLMLRFAMWRLFNAMKPFPLLVTRGETSDVLSPKTAKLMIKRHPDGKLVTIPGRGHAPMLDEPAAVSAISQFLKKIEAQS